MSFNLSISGHVNDAETAIQVDEILKEKGSEIIAALAEFEISGLTANFSGPSGSTNLNPPSEPDEPSEPTDSPEEQT